MSLLWGIKPLHLSNFQNTEYLIEQVSRWGCDQAYLKPGDHIVVVTGSGVLERAHNLLLVHTVGQS
jgi:pyruvate kinase